LLKNYSIYYDKIVGLGKMKEQCLNVIGYGKVEIWKLMKRFKHDITDKNQVEDEDETKYKASKIQFQPHHPQQ